MPSLGTGFLDPKICFWGGGLLVEDTGWKIPASSRDPEWGRFAGSDFSQSVLEEGFGGLEDPDIAGEAFSERYIRIIRTLPGELQIRAFTWFGIHYGGRFAGSEFFTGWFRGEGFGDLEDPEWGIQWWKKH